MPNTALLLEKEEAVQGLANSLFQLKFDFILLFFVLLQINKILEASTVWASYRDQKHDLFISDKPVAGYLTGGAGVAGYLTMGSGNASTMSSVPPPVDRVENGS